MTTETSENTDAIELGWRAAYTMRVESRSLYARAPSTIRRYQKIFRENWDANMEIWWDDNTTPVVRLFIRDLGAFKDPAAFEH